MKVSREQAAKNRERIIDTAARQFRERGFDGIGVADLMKKAGLTHGGFYGHFSSKEELMALACERALSQTFGQWAQAAEAGGNAVREIADFYLSPLHRDHPGKGCVVAALASEAARQSPGVRSALSDGMRKQLDALEPLMPGRTRAARAERARSVYASLVGALILSRVVDDPELSEGFLGAVAKAVQT